MNSSILAEVISYMNQNDINTRQLAMKLDINVGTLSYLFKWQPNLNRRAFRSCYRDIGIS